MAEFKATFAKLGLPKSGALALPVFSGRKLGSWGTELNLKSDRFLEKAMKSADFSGDAGQTLKLILPPKLGVDCLVLFGLGKQDEAKDAAFEEAGGTIAAQFRLTHAAITIAADHTDSTRDAELADHLAFGAGLAAYSFEQYRPGATEAEKPKLTKLTVLCADPTAARTRFAKSEAVLAGIYTARDLANEPANVLTPPEFSRRCAAMKTLGLTIQVLGPREMKKLGMGALLGVAQGSSFDPALVVMTWNGGKKNAKPVALVGKGLTFDSGGLSTKLEPFMWSMKADMAGAAAVVGAMEALARRKAKVNVVAVLPIAENMPDSRAQRPGDIVTTMSGKTVEVINTDGEGRLVLADAMTYAAQKIKPELMIELSTLTGGIMSAMGFDFAGIMTESDPLAAELLAAGETSRDRLWRMPMGKPFEKSIKSAIADLKNTPDDLRIAQTPIGATFLQHFAGGVTFAHLDIASTCLGDPKPPLYPTFGTGYGVRLIDQWVRTRFENG